MSMEEKEIVTLIKAAQASLKFSHSPYSNLKVGSALLTKEGTIFSGANIENASFVAGICAERVALGKAVSEGHKHFKAIAIVADNGGVMPYPCGVCRQALSEFSKDMLVIIAKNETDYKTYKLTKLLPHQFEFKK